MVWWVCAKEVEIEKSHPLRVCSFLNGLHLAQVQMEKLPIILGKKRRLIGCKNKYINIVQKKKCFQVVVLTCGENCSLRSPSCRVFILALNISTENDKID